jgi:hypothetical protein
VKVARASGAINSSSWWACGNFGIAASLRRAGFSVLRVHLDAQVALFVERQGLLVAERHGGERARQVLAADGEAPAVAARERERLADRDLDAEVLLRDA